jgi:PAS domain S-box-containing protein
MKVDDHETAHAPGHGEEDDAARALLTSDACFRKLFDFSPIGLALIGEDGCIEATNATLRLMLGYTEMELRAKPLRALTHPEATTIDRALFNRLARGDLTQYETEQGFLRRHGSVFPARLRLISVTDPAAARIRTIAMVVEVTIDGDERHERGRLLHELRERVKEATAMYEVAQMVRDQRASVRTLLERISSLIPPAFQYPEVTAARVRYGTESVETAGYVETEWNLEAPFVTTDGTAGAINVTYLAARPPAAEGPFLEEERRLLESMAAVLSAILDRRSADRALQAANEHLRLAQKAAQMGIWEVDLLTNEMSWSPELEEILGSAPGRFAGTMDAFWAIIHEEDRAHVERAMRNAIDDPLCDGVFESEFRFIAGEGAIRSVLSCGRVLRDDNGRAQRMIGMAHDITGVRMLEEQLLHSQKMDALGRLAGGVAHDFNNMLTAITGYAEFVMQDLGAEHPSRADVAQIAAAAERAAHLTRQLLAFSRRQVLAPRVVDPNEVVAGMEGLLRRLLQSDVALRVILAPDIGAVCVDPGQLEQVIMNLAVNARDAMPDGGTLTIETSIVEFDEDVQWHKLDLHAGRYVMLAVSDTGTGMTAETKARLFEPFFTTKELGRGTGLGLATVYGIVQQSGGAIWVYSEPHYGSSFKVYLPWVGEQSDPVAISAPPERARGHSERVLIIDDDAAVRGLMERTLRAYGYETLAAGDGMEGLQLLEARGFDVDLVIIDVMLPRLAGPEVAQRILAARPRARLLFVTGYSDRTIEISRFSPSTRILEKPFTPSRLARAVWEILDGEA